MEKNKAKMKKISKRHKLIDGVKVNTKLVCIQEFNALKVEVGTTGFCGGDTGHGCKTYLSIINLAGTDIKVKPFGPYGNDGFILSLGGDSELSTFIEALEFAVKTLKEQKDKKTSNS